jgi:hypothetical protein
MKVNLAHIVTTAIPASRSTYLGDERRLENLSEGMHLDIATLTPANRIGWFSFVSFLALHSYVSFHP